MNMRLQTNPLIVEMIEHKNHIDLLKFAGAFEVRHTFLTADRKVIRTESVYFKTIVEAKSYMRQFT